MKLAFRIYSIWSVILTVNYAQGGPVSRSSRMVREIYPEVEQEIPENTQLPACIIGDVVYSSGSSVPGSQPCLKCLCSSGEIRCEAEACPPQPGCRAVHRQGRCCPTYECECVHQGRVFANGERLPQPDGAECSVCYCRGGHVQCAEVGCYTRNDCEARFVKGQCCPRYDHCPPRDPLSSPSTLQNLDPDLITSWSQPNTTQMSAEEGSGDEEVFLSDDPRKGSTPVTFSIKEIESKTSKRQDNKEVFKFDKSTQTDSDGRPKITIQEIIPPRSEFIQKINPVTLKTQENDVESFASEKSEVFHNPPPILRIGDQLLFINQGQLIPEKDANTPSSIITLIGAEGLQIGLGSGELIMVSEKDVLSTSEGGKDTGTTESYTDLDNSTEKTEELVSSEFITMNDSFSSSTLSAISSETSSMSPPPILEDYIPEENPYYPPIPEDIMSMREEITTDITAVKKTDNSDLTVIPLKKSEENTSTIVKILPDVLELRRNITNGNKTTEQWLKNEPTKITIPLLNEKAALPDAILMLTAPSDVSTENIKDNVGNVQNENVQNENVKNVENVQNEDVKSVENVQNENVESVENVETMEEKEEIMESFETTTVFNSNVDASIDSSDFVEILPGFEHPTEKVMSEERIKIDEDSPKNEVELINIEETTQKESFREEIQKRDVVKKVLKPESFENPKENIRTELIETTNFPEVSNEEINIVKPIEEIVPKNITSKTSFHLKSVD